MIPLENFAKINIKHFSNHLSGLKQSWANCCLGQTRNFCLDFFQTRFFCLIFCLVVWARQNTCLGNWNRRFSCIILFICMVHGGISFCLHNHGVYVLLSTMGKQNTTISGRLSKLYLPPSETNLIHSRTLWATRAPLDAQLKWCRIYSLGGAPLTTSSKILHKIRARLPIDIKNQLTIKTNKQI